MRIHFHSHAICAMFIWWMECQGICQLLSFHSGCDYCFKNRETLWTIERTLKIARRVLPNHNIKGSQLKITVNTEIQ